MSKTLIGIGACHAHHAFEMIMLAHFGVVLVHLSSDSITTLKFYRVEPGAEEIGADAYQHFCIFKMISGYGALTISSFIGQQHSAIGSSIELYMAAAGIFCYKFLDNLFGCGRGYCTGEQYYGSSAET